MKGRSRLVKLVVFLTIVMVAALVPLTAGGQDGRGEGATPGGATGEPAAEAGDPNALWDGDGAAPRNLINDDLTVDGSLCVGLDCNTDPPVPGYGFDTIRLKENNLRIHFDDTSSTASFPDNDWRLEANQSSNGGAEWFAIQDATAGRNVVTVEAGARSNALYVESDGDIGVGTSNPAVDIDIKTGNTPTVRLQQDGTSGFTPQSWDLAGNEANFFIRDVTNGSQLPFRIEPGTATNTLYLDADEQIGIGTNNPSSTVHIRSTVPRLRFDDSDSAGTGWRLGIGGNDDSFFLQEGSANNNVYFRVLKDGTLRLLTQASAPSSPQNGDLYVDTDSGGTLCFRSSGAWIAVAGGGTCS